MLCIHGNLVHLFVMIVIEENHYSCVIVSLRFSIIISCTAVSCDHHAVISYLLQVAKARTHIADCDGNLPQDVTENQATRQLFN